MLRKIAQAEGHDKVRDGDKLSSSLLYGLLLHIGSGLLARGETSQMSHIHTA